MQGLYVAGAITECPFAEVRLYSGSFCKYNDRLQNSRCVTREATISSQASREFTRSPQIFFESHLFAQRPMDCFIYSLQRILNSSKV